MKRAIAAIITILLVISLLAVGVFAAPVTTTLTGPGTVRAGDTITLSFNMDSDGIYGVSGSLSYDKSQVTLVSTTQKIGSPWVVEFNGDNFVAYDNELSSPINSKKTLFTAKFKVKDLPTGTTIKISCIEVNASVGTADAYVGTVSYSATVAAPLSSQNELSALTVGNATISPAFSPDKTSYTAEVPYAVSELDVHAIAADPKAKVSVNSPYLTPNATTKVTVTVTAENGSTKTYTIAVKRAQDPNYVASSNNDLSGITVEGFLLSPVFDPDKTEYVVWLPFETESIVASGSSADGKASVRTEGGTGLVAGQDNVVKVICTAEDGTEKIYTVIAKRAAPHEDASAEPTPTEPTEPAPTEPAPTDPTQPTEPAPTEPTTVALATSSGDVAWWWLLIVAAACLCIGFAASILMKKKR